MATNGGPNTIEDGLVLSLDAANGKSFRGEPTENLFSDPDFDNVSGNWNNRTQYTSGGVDGGSFGGSTSTWSFYQNVNITSGKVYSISGYVRMPSNNSNVRIALDNDDLGNVYVNTNGQWTYFEYTTPPATSTRSDRIYILDQSKNNNEVQADKFQIEEKPYSTRFVNGTRGTTVSTGGGWADISGNNNHGEIINGVTTENDSTAQGALEFDGVDDKVNGNWPDILNIDDSTTPRSWEVVFKPYTTGGQMGIFGYKAGSGCTYFCNGGIFIYNERITFNWYDNSNYRFLGDQVSLANTYYHVIATFDTDQIPRLYVNGKLDSSYNSPTNLNYSAGMRIFDIGWNSKNGGRDYFLGEISFVKFYKGKAFSPQEVLQNYNATKSRFNL